MTDGIFNDKEKKKAQQTKSFKEQILADMKEASRLRREGKAEQSDMGRSENHSAANNQLPEESSSQAAKKEETAVVMPVPEGKITDQVVDDVLANLDEVFSPDSSGPSDKKETVQPASQSAEAPAKVSQTSKSIPKETDTAQSNPDPAEADSEVPVANDPSNNLEVKVKTTGTWFDDGEAENWQLPADFIGKHQSSIEEETKELFVSDLTSKTQAKPQPKEETEAEKAEETPKFEEAKEAPKITKKPNQSKDKKAPQDTAVSLNKSRQQQRKKTNRLARKISTVLITFILVLLIGTGVFGYYYVSSALKPVDAKSSKYIQVEIPSGSGNRMIGKILEKAGLIKNAAVFNYYTKFRNYGNLQSGYYNLQKSMSLDEIAKALQKGGTTTPQAPVLGKVLIPEGYTIKQIAKAITSNANTKKKTDKTPFTSKEFLKTVQDKAFISKMVKKYPKLLGSLPDASKVTYQLEGYLFPATYTYEKKTSVEDLIDSMLAAMDANLQNYYDSIESQGKSVNDILTVASLVEKEGSTDDDRKKIAGVFYNRIDQDMPLQSNIAILYAMGKLGEKTTLKEDANINTKIKSPYNVYTNKGLMPGAVDNPGLSAIKAAVEPESTDDLYFVADVTTGKVYYAKTYKEHSANVEKYVNKKIEDSSSE
ncbi:putative aminodeoxychorismate lyase [Streptococcus ratti FA-1 = DSM 20564]|uniref:Endolytic murein transglycosylase n=1 Tax=Streptococcus ratti FA-1 = DSM 20564 TaxID=699248 RepID=A0ABP2QW72_STRRT|nr:endolytic transglycosylase MltG [Streptococcus ratti]EJN93293.1 putative aminodeoxychorismate lyase [Streptococcus ratti FA-1 = DSM 20564]EMP68711.1 putative aminodeoxychorismate lyase [Streptococcus ratti FA-1 = DSM 20564]QEY07193.1 endolytic transglycosylase MltG [Streptococcus ratti]VEI59625.1 putative aminodeoxychorismate lyase [Streptococcus mutans]